MQEKQIFKPFEQFEEGEFDKMFGVPYKSSGEICHYIFLPKLNPESYVWAYAIYKEKAKTRYIRGVWSIRGFLGGNHNYKSLKKTHMDSLSFDEEGEYKGFETLEQAYNALYACFKEAFEGERRECLLAANRSFEEYYELQKETVRMKYQMIINGWNEVVKPAAEQFPNA